MVNGRQPRKDGRWDTVVGVVRNVRREGLDLQPFLTAHNPTNLRELRSCDSRLDRREGPDSFRASRASGRGLVYSAPRRSRGSEPPLGNASRAGASESQALGLFAALALVPRLPASTRCWPIR